MARLAEKKIRKHYRDDAYVALEKIELLCEWDLDGFYKAYFRVGWENSSNERIRVVLDADYSLLSAKEAAILVVNEYVAQLEGMTLVGSV